MNTDAPTHEDIRKVGHILKKIPAGLRGHIVAVIGEFVGTMFFLFFAFAGTQVANISSNNNSNGNVVTTTTTKTPQQLLYISLSFGFSLAVNAWVYFRISGGLFNPAVTLGMVLIGAITWIRGILLFIAQMVGAIVAAYLVQVLFTGGLNVSTTLSATTTIAQGVIIEMLLTTQLVFTIFMLAAEKHTGNFIAPVGIGLSLFIGELVGVFWTGGSLNPARSFAPAVAIQMFHTTQWVYWVGPLSGSCLAVIIFKIIKVLEYETANPDPEAPIPTGPAAQHTHRVASNDTAVDMEKQNDLHYRRAKYVSGTTVGDDAFMSNANGEHAPVRVEPYGAATGEYASLATDANGNTAPYTGSYATGGQTYSNSPIGNYTAEVPTNAQRTNAYTPTAPPRSSSGVFNPATSAMHNAISGPPAGGSTGNTLVR